MKIRVGPNHLSIRRKRRKTRIPIKRCGFSLKDWLTPKPLPGFMIVGDAKHYCKHCHRHLSNRSIRIGSRFCSHRCANRYNGLKRIGKPKKRHTILI